jgi:branched-chain amino acid transport system substrate-binding protein
LARRALAALLLAVLAVGVASCGEDGGAAEDATLTVYLSAPLRGAEGAAGRRLCDEAREQAAQGRGRAQKLRVVCLDAAGSNGRWTLAKVGSNARRATEDSTTVAYIGEPDQQARRQSQPIVDAAGIAEVGGLPGRQAISQIQTALRESDSDDPRDAVFDALG